MKLGRISFILWLAGLAVRLILIFGFHRYELFRSEPVRVAISVANGGGFADPYLIPTGFTAHVAPLYPVLVAPIYYFFGDSQLSDFARMILSVAAAAASYALLPFVARALGMQPAVGIVAGLVGAVLPAHFWPESMGQFETAFVPLFLQLSLIWAAHQFSVAKLTPRSAVLAGVWCGAGLLLSPSVLPPLIGLAAWGIWRAKHSVFPWIAVASCATIVAVAPWMVRNYVRLGGLFLIRDNFGLELYLSNHGSAAAELELNDVTPFFQREHPITNLEMAQEVRDRGELAFEQARTTRAIQWMKLHPKSFARLMGARIRNFWFYGMLRPVPSALLWALNALALCGLLVLMRTSRSAAYLLISVLATYPLIYYFVHNGLRYQHGIYWILLLLAGQFALDALNWMRKEITPAADAHARSDPTIVARSPASRLPIL